MNRRPGVIRNAYRGLIMLILCLFSACANSTTSQNPSAGVISGKPFSFAVSVPGYPNRRFSAYIFGNGALIGTVRSNAMTDSAGNLSVTAVAVDANNCATASPVTQTAASYSMHFRLDGANNGSFVYPSNCPADAGFLNTANIGFHQNYPVYYWPYSLTYLTTSSTVTFQLSGTGLGSVTRYVYCSIVDGTIINPTIFTSSTLGFAQGNIAFSGGSGSSSANVTVVPAITGAYKYTCRIDANNNSAWDSGDLVATSTSPSTLSSWSPAP